MLFEVVLNGWRLHRNRSIIVNDDGRVNLCTENYLPSGMDLIKWMSVDDIKLRVLFH